MDCSHKVAVDAEFREIRTDIKELRTDVKEVQAEMRRVETRTTINEQSIKRLCDDIRAIKSDTRWILRLVVGGFLLGLLKLLISGGA